MLKFSLLSLSLALVAGPALAAPDREFLYAALKGDNTEVAMGRLAQTHSRSPRVRAYGMMLVRDHGAHKMKIVALGRMIGVRSTNALSNDGMRARDMMAPLRGERFDAAFKEHMIQDHQTDIDKYQSQMRETRNPRVRSLTTQTLPTLRKHLVRAKAL